MSTHWGDERDPTINYHGGNAESTDAYESIRASKTTTLALITRYLREVDTSTCDEWEQASGMRHQTASARFTDLRAAGAVVLTGERRKTRSGRSAAVYALNELMSK